MHAERIDRLRHGRDITAVLRGRHQRAGAFAAVHVRAGRHARPARVAVIASRRVGNAVARNRCKRLLREAARHVAWTPGSDVVIVARATCASQGFDDVHHEVARLAEQLAATRVVA